MKILFKVAHEIRSSNYYKQYFVDNDFNQLGWN
jgi:hypothetical protein